MIVSVIFFILVSITCFLNFNISLPWIVVFVLALVLQVFVILPHICDVYFNSITADWVKKIGRFFMGWYMRHLFGAVIVSIPLAAVFSNFSCHMFGSVLNSDLFYALTLIVTLLHYCNFTILSSWLKSSLATISAILLLVCISVGVCTYGSSSDDVTELLLMGNDTTTTPSSNVTAILNGTVSSEEEDSSLDIFLGEGPLRFEIVLNVAILLVLIWFLNREFEVSCRLSYHGDVQAINDRKQMQNEKEQAEWLLHNIIPQHVTDVLKKTSKYCKNHTDVGVVFAKITNFDDFYDESYEGGKEYLRVLNELIGDFEELFDDERFKDVEKIKTIGACLMVASGLNTESRQRNRDPHAHLYALLEFCQHLLLKLEDFNSEIFNFNFEMAIGFNCGPVTAGVIGTTKLLYDIWGDTVNVSSRMYSTGLPGRIQMTDECSQKVLAKFVFEYKGSTYVKGKGDMPTVLLVDKKEGASWD